jgi:hydrogenase maturation protease
MVAADRPSAEAARPVPPILVFACGNPSRGDDALGPLFVERLEALAPQASWRSAVETLTDFQLQVEHALDVVGRRCVVFVDAGISGFETFSWSAVVPERDATFTSHVMSPSAVLQAYVDVHARPPPPCFALCMRAYAVELGQPPGAPALANLDAAMGFFLDWLEQAVAIEPTGR